MGRRAVPAALACVVLLAGGCIRSDLVEVESARDDAPAASERTELGEPVTTAQGNTVTVHRVDDGAAVEGSDLILISAQVEICADEDGEGAPSDPRFFRAVIPGEGYRRPAPSDKSPQLEVSEIEAGDCVRGWVSFPVRPDEEATGIVLLASTIVEWSLS